MRTRLAARAVVPAGILAVVALAAVLPPALVVPHAAELISRVLRAWSYFWSMLFGASPFLAAGAAIGAALARAPRVWNSIAVALLCICLPGCDCTLNGYCGALGRVRSPLGGFLAAWGSCCNPLALAATALVLGHRILLLRMFCAAVAGSLTALSWLRLPSAPHAHAQAQQGCFLDCFIAHAAKGFESFALAAAAAALVLAVSSRSAFGASGMLAALAGSVLSPCSSADSLLARSLFADPKSQVAFIVAAQCLGVRQWLVLRAAFGLRKSLWALGSGAAACALGYALA